MTKKDFFRVIIKLYGLYWLVNNIFSISQITYFYAGSSNDVSTWIYSVGILTFSIIIFVLLIVGADKIIQWLKLDKGFDDDRIEFHNFNIQNILMLAMILIGATMIVDNIGTFLNQLYLSVKVFMANQTDLITMNGQNVYLFWLSLTKIILGYILLTNYPSISKFLLKITQKKD